MSRHLQHPDTSAWYPPSMASGTLICQGAVAVLLPAGDWQHCGSGVIKDHPQSANTLMAEADA